MNAAIGDRQKFSQARTVTVRNLCPRVIGMARLSCTANGCTPWRAKLATSATGVAFRRRPCRTCIGFFGRPFAITAYPLQRRPEIDPGY